MATLDGIYSAATTCHGAKAEFSLQLHANGTLNGVSLDGTTISGTFTIPDASKAAIRYAFQVTPPEGQGETLSMTGASLIEKGRNGTMFEILASGDGVGLRAFVKKA